MREVSLAMRSVAAALATLGASSCVVDHVMAREERLSMADDLGGDGGLAPVTCYVISPSERGPVVPLVAADMTTGALREDRQWTLRPGGLRHSSAMAYDGRRFLVPGSGIAGISWFSFDPNDDEPGLFFSADRGFTRTVGWSGADWIAPRKDRSGMARYSTVEALMLDEPSQVLPGRAYEHFAVSGRVVYGLAGAPFVIEVRSLATAELLRVLAPQWPGGQDVSVRGMSVVGRTLYFLTNPSGLTYATVYSLDLDVGEVLARARIPGDSPIGLHCATAPP